MNKIYLKSYFANALPSNKEKFKNKYVKYESGYLIIDSVSIVKLNSDYGVLTELADNVKDTIVRMYEDFEYNFCLHNVDITKDIENCEEENFKFLKDYSSDIKEEKYIINYGVDMKRLNTIKKMLKADKIELLTKYTYGYMYVVKIKNTKTNEVGYLLPTKIYYEV